MKYTIDTSNLSDYQKGEVKQQSPERQEFIEKQINICDDNMMKGNMFMSADGKCWNCKKDVIAREIEKGNDGSGFVTGCPHCFRSYCD